MINFRQIFPINFVQSVNWDDYSSCVCAYQQPCVYLVRDYSSLVGEGKGSQRRDGCPTVYSGCNISRLLSTVQYLKPSGPWTVPLTVWPSARLWVSVEQLDKDHRICFTDSTVHVSTAIVACRRTLKPKISKAGLYTFT